MAFLAARPLHVANRLIAAVFAATFLLAGFAQVPALSLTDPRGDMTLAEARQYMLELINRDRASEGLPALALDDTACGAAQEHSDEMARWGYLSHWDLQGRKPDQRYCEAGGDGAVFENVYTNHNNPYLGARQNPLSARQLFARREVERAQAWFFNQQAPRDGHRRNILDRHHDRVGLGLSLASDRKYGSRITVAQEFVHRAGSISGLPAGLGAGNAPTLKGRLERGLALHSLQVCRESLPTPMTTADLKQTSSYSYPTASVVSYFPMSRRSGGVTVNRLDSGEEFSVDLSAGRSWHDGLYYIIVWVRDGSGGQPYIGSTRVVKMGASTLSAAAREGGRDSGS